MTRLMMLALIGMIAVAVHLGCSGGASRAAGGSGEVNSAKAGGEERYYEERFSSRATYEPFLGEYYVGK